MEEKRPFIFAVFSKGAFTVYPVIPFGGIPILKKSNIRSIIRTVPLQSDSFAQLSMQDKDLRKYQQKEIP